ncbi:MAG: 30S ribosomal protein S3 [Chloroflexi bacterium]|nr:30S ribosomal protein S3 [Chloroflexota bacterium]
MGQKTHPVGFRLGIIRDWDATWFAPKGKAYKEWLLEDLKIRQSILDKYPDAGISHIKIERSSNDITITLHTSRPGIVIGRGGQRIDELRHEMESLTGKRSRVNVQEIRQAELDAYLVARSVADQLQRRIAFRRAMRQAVTRAMQSGAQGIKIVCSGRLGGAEIARTEKVMVGRVPLHTLRADIDYGLAEAATVMGRIGVKVWLYKGDVFPKPREATEELGTIEVTLGAAESEGGSGNAATP